MGDKENPKPKSDEKPKKLIPSVPPEKRERLNEGVKRPNPPKKE